MTTAGQTIRATIPDDLPALKTVNAEPIAVAYCTPEKMAEGTSNLLLIALQPDRQRRGIGAALMRRVEDALEARGERVLLVETSGLPAISPVAICTRLLDLRKLEPISNRPHGPTLPVGHLRRCFALHFGVT